MELAIKAKHVLKVNEKYTLKQNFFGLSDGQGTGGALWTSSIEAAKCLKTMEMEDCWCMELGCGIGYLGIVAVQECKVGYYVATDGDTEVLDLASFNCTRNVRNDLRTKFTTKVYAWGDAVLQLEKLDIVIGSDVLYDSAMHCFLLKTLCSLRDQYGTLRLLLAYRRRDEDR